MHVYSIRLLISCLYIKQTSKFTGIRTRITACSHLSLNYDVFLAFFLGSALVAFLHSVDKAGEWSPGMRIPIMHSVDKAGEWSPGRRIPI